jgi:hypothetical protein
MPHVLVIVMNLFLPPLGQVSEEITFESLNMCNKAKETITKLEEENTNPSAELLSVECFPSPQVDVPVSLYTSR